MIDDTTVEVVLRGAILVMVGLLLPCAYRAARGPSIADRLLAIDLITTLLTGIIVLIAILDGAEILIDIGIGLAALSFIGTVSIARFISDGKVF